jgi:hypothetical protein
VLARSLVPSVPLPSADEAETDLFAGVRAPAGVAQEAEV